MNAAFGARALCAALVLFPLVPAASALAKDPFLWLEQVEGKRALQWVKAHNTESAKALRTDPLYETFREEAAAIVKAEDRIPYGEIMGGYVYNHWQDSEHVQGLWRRASLDSYMSDNPAWEVLLDLDAMSKADNETWVFKGASCLPPEYERCLLTLSRGGSDAAEVREFDVPSKRFVAGGFALKEAKSDVAWLDRDTVFAGTDFGKGSLTASGYPRILKIWRRGQKPGEAETFLEGKTEDVSVYPLVFHTPGGAYALGVRAVTFFDQEFYFRGPEGKAIKLPLPLSSDLRGFLDGQLVATLRADWTVETREGTQTIPQGAMFAFSLDDYLAGGGKLPAIEVLYKQGARDAIEDVMVGGEAVYVSLMDNVRGRLRVYTHDDSWEEDEIEVPENGSVSIKTADELSGRMMFQYASFLVPDRLYYVDGEDDPVAVKSLPERFSAAGAVTEQFEATSADGTKVPYFFIHHEGDSGPSPTLLYGYGGFQISLTPWYWTSAGKLWLERGGAMAVANIRGGGEFGPAWHEAARLANRQRAYDDFLAVAEDMIRRGLTDAKHLGIAGGSNGGLLVGVAVTQRPDLFNAVVCDNPLLDMLRYTELPPGASWIAEYGDPKEPKERAAIEAYSPYQHVKADADYPVILFTTSTKDDRVNPAHARKMAALLESYGKPVLFYENTEGGHSSGANLDQVVDVLALRYVYLHRRLMGEAAGQ